MLVFVATAAVFACSTLFVLQPTIAAYEATGHKIEVSAISDAAGTEKQ